MDASELRAVFGGHEPLENEQLSGQFATLLGVSPDARPFECVGDVAECRTALLLTAARSDRRGNPLLASLRTRVAATGEDPPTASQLLAPFGPHYIPDRYAPPDLLVHAH